MWLWRLEKAKQANSEGPLAKVGAGQEPLLPCPKPLLMQLPAWDHPGAGCCPSAPGPRVGWSSLGCVVGNTVPILESKYFSRTHFEFLKHFGSLFLETAPPLFLSWESLYLNVLLNKVGGWENTGKTPDVQDRARTALTWQPVFSLMIYLLFRKADNLR